MLLASADEIVDETRTEKQDTSRAPLIDVAFTVVVLSVLAVPILGLGIMPGIMRGSRNAGGARR